MISLETKRFLKFGLTILFSVFYQYTSISQELSKKNIRSNSIDIKEDISILLTDSHWKEAFTGKSKRKKVKKIKKESDIKIWQFNSNKNRGTLIFKGTDNTTKKKWEANWALTVYPEQNTFLIKFSEIQFTPYKIIKANEEFMIIQEIDKFKFDQETGVVLTKEELKRKSEARGEMLFGGMVINIGAPTYKRIVLIKER